MLALIEYTIVLRHCKYGTQIVTVPDFHSADKIIAIHVLNKHTLHIVQVQVSMDTY